MINKNHNIKAVANFDVVQINQHSNIVVGETTPTVLNSKSLGKQAGVKGINLMKIFRKFIFDIDHKNTPKVSNNFYI